ncbi:MAG: hypothetical protein JWP36_1130 [Paucimonas sp.]|nr:hypothetical protein [Paucimonas sp.]
MDAKEQEFPSVDGLMLSAAELKALTGYARTKLQARVLGSLGVPYVIRPDNSLLVLRMHLQVAPKSIERDRPMLNSARRRLGL